VKYLSVCSGIEAATVAWKPLGWEPVGFSEIDPFACSVLQHHYPNVTNYGDMTHYERWNIKPGTVDLLCGGTPCQAFSTIGKRAGLSDDRGQLALVYLRLAAHLQPRWIVWENVVGVLHSNGGRDFGAFLRALGDSGYRWCYRVLDARYFGVAQSRRRIFLVAFRGNDHADWRYPSAALLERPGLCGDRPPKPPKGHEITGCVTSRGGSARCNMHAEEGFLRFAEDGRLRWITPLETERLMGFEDGYTDISKASDSARYKALGNSWCVPVARWVGKRIQMVEDLMAAQQNGLKSVADCG
jgi:DNA (cytosine-5)-methyltransferase 1